MIRVTIDLVPHGVEAAKETLGQFVIGNDGTGDHEIGNYNIFDENPERLRDWEAIGRIEGFERQRPSYTKGWMRLVAQALNVVAALERPVRGEYAESRGEGRSNG